MARKQTVRYGAVTGMLLLASSGSLQALPEDSEQPIIGVYESSLMLLDEGKQVFYGSAEAPAEITQGTLRIRGLEITIERQDGKIRNATVSGTPAHFEQIPSASQPLVTAEGDTIIMNYETQHVSADGNVRFTQGEDSWTGCHVDYYMETRQLSTPRCENGEPSRAVITPRNNR